MEAGVVDVADNALDPGQGARRGEGLVGKVTCKGAQARVKGRGSRVEGNLGFKRERERTSTSASNNESSVRLSLIGPLGLMGE